MNTGMTSRRSSGVVLIVALFAWSVNLRVIACAGLPSRAAVVVPEGSPPAPKPEPSPSHHNCCPLESKHSKKGQSFSLPDGKLHASLDLSCCSIAKNPASRMPFQKVSRFDLRQFVAIDAAVDRQAATVQAEDAAFPSVIPTRIASGSTSVLRL